MELNQLKYFQTAARLGNISKAAAELFVTQPNLSKSISRLEEELGVPLFDHRKGKIVLNDYGRMFLTSVNLCLAELNTGVQAIQRVYERNQHILSVGSSVDDFLPDVLRDFAPLHPEIGIRQVECTVSDLIAKLHSGSIDLAITSRPIDDSRLCFDLLGEKSFVILVGPGHPLSERKAVHLKELADERFICDHSRMDRTALNEICRQSGFEPTIAFEVQNTQLIYNLLAGSNGIAFMPIAQMSKLERDHPGSGIHHLRILDDIAPALLGAVYPKDYAFTNAARLFLDFLKHWLAKEDITLARYDDSETSDPSN